MACNQQTVEGRAKSRGARKRAPTTSEFEAAQPKKRLPGHKKKTITQVAVILLKTKADVLENPAIGDETRRRGIHGGPKELEGRSVGKPQL